MRRVALNALLFLALVSPLGAADSEARPLAGVWRYVPERSTQLSSWGSLKLVIVVDGPHVVITRQYAAGRRTFDEVTPLDLSRQINLVPVEWWPDNRHLGAYIGGDKTKTIRTRLRDEGRLLRVSADFVLATQQGERMVNVLSDYKVSSDGLRLTLTELRSTRDDPIVYRFRRVTNPAADERESAGRAE